MSACTASPQARPAVAALLTLALAAPLSAQTNGRDTTGAPDLSAQVEIRRTTYGVPHIRAENLRAMGYGLAWVQLEDYGPRVALGLLRGRGEMGRYFGRDSMESDFYARRDYFRAIDTYHLIDADTREVYEGFAAGMNRFIELHPDRFPEGFRPGFTGYDVATRDVAGASLGAARRFLDRIDPSRRTGQRRAAGPGESEGDPNDGSNAWAFAPSRTKSGRAILLRNPHLSWTAGYYEAHVIVPGVLEWYGDFRVGGPFTVIGGFNRHLGWSTTNNAPDLDEIYALDVAPGETDRYAFEGTTVPLRRELVTVEYRNGDGYSTETREMWYSPLGPVIHRADGKIYVIRAAADGDYRAGEQYLRMMRSTSLAQWKEAMRMRARVASNFTYADRAGNILIVWNATIPKLPHPSGGDTAAIPARRTSDIWTEYVPFDSLPQFLNPRGGYVHNENDAPYYGNMRQPLDPARYPAYFEPARLRLRSQLAIELIDNNRKLSLEDVVRLKHSYRMLAADRLKPDLVSIVRQSNPQGDTLAALQLLEKWDNTTAHESRGGMLFETWALQYDRLTGGDDSVVYAHPWTPADPLKTPRGIGDRAKALEAFQWAVGETKRRYGAIDMPWGDVNRLRRGKVDAPVGGCSGALGCFRVLSLRPDSLDGSKRTVVGGDGWVLAVEFTDVPRAYSILAYGMSPDSTSPHHDDQAAMFARGEMKKVAFTERDIEAQTIRRYRPGRQ